MELSNLEQFLKHFFGEQPIVWWLAVLAWAFIGCVLNLYFYAINNRNPNSPSTPRKFSILFLMWDNIQRLFAGFILTFIFLRFSVELLGSSPTIYLGLFYGLVSDKLMALLNKLELAARK